MDNGTLDRMKSWFAGYCGSFYTENAADNRNIRLKEEHSQRVLANINLLTESLALAVHDRLLAEAVALFHDLGRFQQYRQYKTFRDADSVNHAALGAKIVAEEELLAELTVAERQTVIRAVAQHNVFMIPAGLTERDLLFLKLIRDADKLDIWRVFIEFYALPDEERASAVSLGFPDVPVCSKEVLACLHRQEMVDLKLLKTLGDFKLLQLSWVHDLNFPASFRLMEERDYINRLAATLPATREVASALESVLAFVERRMALAR
jgi:hypothetical protein